MQAPDSLPTISSRRDEECAILDRHEGIGDEHLIHQCIPLVHTQHILTAGPRHI